MGIVYLDTSVALRTILDVPERTRLQDWMDASHDVHVSSRLLHPETIRALPQDGRPVSDGAPMLSRVGLLDITRQTHVIAGSFDRHVRTLDLGLRVTDPVAEG